jgi:hypothetical protein
VIYAHYPRKCSPEFREAVLNWYPALSGNAIYLGIMEHVLFTPFDWDEANQSYQLLTHEMLAEIAGVDPHNGEFRSGRLIEDFSREVLPLNATGWDHAHGLARRVRPEVARDLLSLPRRRRGGDQVSFLTGTPVSQRSLKQSISSYDRALRDQVEEKIITLVEIHPATDLIKRLNGQPISSIRGYLRRNWEALVDAAGALPPGEAREHTLNVLDVIEDHCAMIYGPSDHTARIHATGVNITQLPRELRCLAVSGAVHVDLRAAQLAIVGNLWNVPGLLGFLRTGQSIWTELLSWIDADPECKPVLKTAVYGICFGMGRKKLRATLEEGSPREPGLGPVKAALFLRHPLITELLEARDEAQRRATEDGYLIDAFGREIEITRVSPAHKGLALQAQSFELRIMLATLPVLDAEEGISVIYWLHDGAAFHFRHKAEQDRQIRRIVQAVNAEADRLGIPTELEVSIG